jgi:YgiT-type zinc finger domain-containing protein
MSASRCVFCKTGELAGGEASLTLTREATAVIVQHIPADICDNCGHAYFDGEIVRQLERLHETVLASGVTYAVRDFGVKVA